MIQLVNTILTEIMLAFIFSKIVITTAIFYPLIS